LRPFVERLTLPGEKSSKKWELRANEIALDLVAPMYGTTPQNLRDLLRKSKPYTIVLQNYVLALDDPRVLLTGNAPLPEVLPLALTNYGRGSLERMIRSFLMRE
jgi:hypothetical protein